MKKVAFSTVHMVCVMEYGLFERDDYASMLDPLSARQVNEMVDPYQMGPMIKWLLLMKWLIVVKYMLL